MENLKVLVQLNQRISCSLTSFSILFSLLQSVQLISTEKSEEVEQVSRYCLKGALIQSAFSLTFGEVLIQRKIISNEMCCISHFHCFSCVFQFTAHTPFILSLD